MHVAIGAGGLGFDSLAGQIGHSVADASPSLRRFFGTEFRRRKAVEMGSVARYKLRQYHEYNEDA